MKRFWKVLILTSLISVFLCGCGKDPYSVKVDGKKYTFNAEWGIKDLGKMSGVGKSVSGGLNKEVVCVNLDGEKVDYEDVNATLSYWVNTRCLGAGGLMMQQCEFENGCELGKGPGWVFKGRFEDKMDFAGFDITFCNNYNYLGITQESSVQDIKDAEFQKFAIDDVYYRLDCKKKVSEEKIDELYEELLDLKPNSDVIAESFETGEYLNYALTLVPVGHADLTYHINQFRDVIKNENFKDAKKQLKIAIEFSCYLKMLDEGKIDSFVLSFASTKGILDHVEGKKNDDTTVEVIVFASRENAKKWGEKWGWEKNK